MNAWISSYLNTEEVGVFIMIPKKQIIAFFSRAKFYGQTFLKIKSLL